ncbi:unnamed protein product [Oppiella nova]|uniref:Uncharacterized protein n=1 Tax=Oppiella nova TaxID=334625 RepID=A0A7R9MBI9_9ACAR|nr:unnamed protein product [Oppiella nova]CAG2173808.1 unnamed protein product [Oppiella nova]
MAKRDTERDCSPKPECDEELSQTLTQMSTENKDLREELMALKASKGMIETEVKALRDAMKDINEELVSLKASKEFMFLKETNVKIESHLNVLTALEGCRQVVDNTDTESMASVQTINDKTCGQMRGDCMDFESMASTSMSASMEDIPLEPNADKILWFARKYSQKLTQMCEIWKSLSGLRFV